MATIARNVELAKGQSVIVLGEQFPSHVYPWRQLATDTGARLQTIVAPSALGTSGRGALWNERLVGSIGEETAIVAVPNVHWADGTVCRPGSDR